MFFQIDSRVVNNWSFAESDNNLMINGVSVARKISNQLVIQNSQREITPSIVSSFSSNSLNESFFENGTFKSNNIFNSLYSVLTTSELGYDELNSRFFIDNLIAFYKREAQSIYALFKRTIGPSTNTSCLPYSATNFIAENKKGIALAVQDIEKPKICPAPALRSLPLSLVILSPYVVIGGIFFLTSVMATFYYLRKYFQAQKSISESEIKAIQSICDFYKSSSNEDTIGGYCNKFKVQGVDDALTNKKVDKLIREKINFYSNVSLNSEVKLICNEHIKVLKVLQKAVSYKEGRVLSTLARIETVGVSVLLALILQIPMQTFSVNSLGTFPLTVESLCFLPLVALMSKLFFEMQICLIKEKQKKFSDFVFKQTDILFSTSFFGIIDFFGDSPWINLGNSSSGLFSGPLDSTFEDTKDEAIELSKKFIEKYSKKEPVAS